MQVIDPTSADLTGKLTRNRIAFTIRRSSVTVCSRIPRFVDATSLPPQLDSLSFHLVQESPGHVMDMQKTNHMVTTSTIPISDILVPRQRGLKPSNPT